VALMALALAACGGGESAAPAPGQATDDANGAAEGPSEVSGEFDWRRYEGETIRMVANQHPWQEAIQPLVGEFTELTGIEVEFEALPEAQFRQRVQVEMTSGSEDLDVFMTNVQNEGATFAANDWYADLRAFAEDEAITSEEYDFDDLSPGVLDGHSFGETLTGIPIQLETQMLFYRTDIFEEHGVEVPQTMEELEAVAAEIDDPEGTRAFTARGRAAASVTQISTYLFNFGGAWTTDDGQAAFASPEGVEAFDFYGRMVREYGPPGAVNNSWEEALPLFQQGEVAMYTDASTFLPQIIDEETSQVADTVGFAKMPAGPGGEFQTFNGWALGISAFTQKANPAWYFVQWATSPEMVERLTAEGIAGARQSIDFGETYPEDWVTAFTESLGDARAQLPAVQPVAEVRDAIGQAVVESISGGEVEPAVEAAAQSFDSIVASGPAPTDD
jgi:multiple sugar transport system substrate-binding protein